MLLICPLQAFAVTFFDGTFDDGDWDSFKLVDTTGFAAATFAAGQVGSGGNPDAFRQVTHTFGPGNIGVRHLFTGGVYDPGASGAIASIDYSYDLIHIDPPPSQAVRYRLALAQNNSLYVNIGDLIFTEEWASFGQTGLQPGDFSRVAGGGPSQPDFGADAGSFFFGYWTENTNSGGASQISRTSGIDNWSVTVNVVPVPAAAWLMLSALGSLMIGLRRRP